MSPTETVVQLVFLAAAACFVIGLHLMNSPRTARRGNQISMVAMACAVVAAVVLIAVSGQMTVTGWIIAICGFAFGGGIRLYVARSVAMTAVPQLVSLFNAVGGGAAALLAVHDLTTGLPVDTTAAGDAFVGGLLHQLARLDGGAGRIDHLVGELPRLHATLRFAAACGALTVTRQGSFTAMPDEAEVLNFMETYA